MRFSKICISCSHDWTQYKHKLKKNIISTVVYADSYEDRHFLNKKIKCVYADTLFAAHRTGHVALN